MVLQQPSILCTTPTCTFLATQCILHYMSIADHMCIIVADHPFLRYCVFDQKQYQTATSVVSPSHQTRNKENSLHYSHRILNNSPELLYSHLLLHCFFSLICARYPETCLYAPHSTKLHTRTPHTHTHTRSQGSIHMHARTHTHTQASTHTHTRCRYTRPTALAMCWVVRWDKSSSPALLRGRLKGVGE